MRAGSEVHVMRRRMLGVPGVLALGAGGWKVVASENGTAGAVLVIAGCGMSDGRPSATSGAVLFVARSSSTAWSGSRSAAQGLNSPCPATSPRRAPDTGDHRPQ